MRMYYTIGVPCDRVFNVHDYHIIGHNDIFDDIAGLTCQVLF